MTSTTHPKTALVTGANGFIGRNVAKTFARAGYRTYGLLRRETAAADLIASEVVPVIGSPGNLAFLPELLKQSPTFDVVVSTTEQIANYVPHYDEIVSLARSVAKASGEAGVRPLVLFTSGCKDYGMGAFRDDPTLAPHTEESPIAPQPWAEARATNAVRIFEHADLFDAVVFRPVTLYGYDGSLYGPYLELAERAKISGGPLELPADPKTVLHGMHVQDVAEGYLAVAEAKRDLVRGQAFNLSSRRYETLEEIATKLVEEYGLPREVKYADPQENDWWAKMNAGFTQWVSSDKIRTLLGWKDVKPLFSEGLHVYRMTYEAARGQGHEGVLRMQNKVGTTRPL